MDFSLILHFSLNQGIFLVRNASLEEIFLEHSLIEGFSTYRDSALFIHLSLLSCKVIQIALDQGNLFEKERDTFKYLW